MQISYFCHMYTACFKSSGTKWLGEGKMCSSCFVNMKYTYLICISHFYIWKQWECSRLKSRRFCGVLRVMFLSDNKINESWRNWRQERTERGPWCSFGNKISNNRSKPIFSLVYPKTNLSILIDSYFELLKYSIATLGSVHEKFDVWTRP